MGLSSGDKGAIPGSASSVRLQQRIEAPAERVAAYVTDFRNSQSWMVGVESVEALGDDAYRVTLETPIGKLRPDVQVTGRGDREISWVYTSTVEGGGEVQIEPTAEGCEILYSGDFGLKRKLLGKAARLAGMERFARRNGERSLVRLKSLMEAGRY